MVDIPFVTYEFEATGGSTPRSMPDRLADTINVLDYGADPTGVANSHTAIQDAIDAAAASGNIAAGRKGGIVFFPPGLYLCNGTPLDNSTASSTVYFQGSGKYASVIQGTNNTGYIFQLGQISFTQWGGIADLGIVNLSTTSGTGAVYARAMVCALIKNCLFKGYNGLAVDNESYCHAIVDCTFTGSSISGSVGICCQQIGMYNCDFTDWGSAIAIYNSGQSIMGCSITSCEIGINIGVQGASLTPSSAQGYAICGTIIDKCDIGITSQGASGPGLISGCVIKGAVGSDGATAPTYGMVFNTASLVSIVGCHVTAECSVAGIRCLPYNYSFYDTTSDIGAGSGVDWSIDTDHAVIVTFNNCNNPFAGVTITNDRVAGPTEGDLFNVTDSTTQVWGATYSGGGALHALVRYNGTNRTVVGK